MGINLDEITDSDMESVSDTTVSSDNDEDEDYEAVAIVKVERDNNEISQDQFDEEIDEEDFRLLKNARIRPGFPSLATAQHSFRVWYCGWCAHGYVPYHKKAPILQVHRNLGVALWQHFMIYESFCKICWLLNIMDR